MIERLIYAITAFALASVILFDKNFLSNLTHAIGKPIAPFNAWKAGVGGALLILAVAAICQKLRR
jgi:hypothetical protein